MNNINNVILSNNFNNNSFLLNDHRVILNEYFMKKSETSKEQKNQILLAIKTIICTSFNANMVLNNLDDVD